MSEKHIRLRQRATYPGTLTHTDEGFNYTAKVTDCGTKQWLKTLTEQVAFLPFPFRHANTFLSFYTRAYNTDLGVKSGEWLLQTVTTYASRNPAATVRTVKTAGYDQLSIIATIPGTSPDLGKLHRTTSPTFL
jgi:hypothetical protein